MSELVNVSDEQIIAKIRQENVWWATGKIDEYYGSMKRRLYAEIFFPLLDENLKRAAVLMGPRRVGKTVMIFHSIQKLINAGVNPLKICYLSIDKPIFNQIGLERLFDLCRKTVNDPSPDGFYIFFDEIQYLKDWEVHLKSLVDSYLRTKFIASGSAAAALKLKSRESGAGRFTDFMLPPLTFCEYIDMKELNNLIIPKLKKWQNSARNFYFTTDIAMLNNHFIEYINYGGYPEIIFNSIVRNNPTRFIESDIIEKVLQKDLPSLYGIADVQELNSLFTTIAFNTGNEFSYEKLSVGAGVKKETLKKYLAYLEAAFLIKIVNKIDDNAKKFTRNNLFKIYLTNPSLRSALFAPTYPIDSFAGNMVETAIYAQWMHRTNKLYYARWKNGEVDIVGINKNQKPVFAIEIKWTNRFYENPAELKSLKTFCKANDIKQPIVTTIDKEGIIEMDGLNIDYVPASLYCYTLGKNALDDKITDIYGWDVVD